MMTYGKIAYEAYYQAKHSASEHNWMGLSQLKRDAWEAAAEAVMQVYESKRIIPEEEEDNK